MAQPAAAADDPAPPPPYVASAATLVDLLPSPIGWNQFQRIVSKACRRLGIHDVDNKLLSHAFEQAMTDRFGPHRKPVTVLPPTTIDTLAEQLVSAQQLSRVAPPPRPRPRRRLEALQKHLHQASGTLQEAITTPTLPANVSKLLCDARSSLTKAMAATARLVVAKPVRKVAATSLKNLRLRRRQPGHT